MIHNGAFCRFTRRAVPRHLAWPENQPFCDSPPDGELPVEVGGPVIVDRGEEREASTLQAQRGLVELELGGNAVLEGNSGPVESALSHGLHRVGILDALSCLVEAQLHAGQLGLDVLLLLGDLEVAFFQADFLFGELGRAIPALDRQEG